MKKIFNKKIFAILALFILPMFLLTACNEVNYYNVQVYFMGYNGNTQGPNVTSSIAEGSEVNLTANASEDSNFICWINKDSSTVVSIDDEYSFTMNAETQGTYIGLFAERSPKYMLIAALTSAQVNVPGVNVFDLTVSITPSLTQTENQTLFSGTVADQNTDVYNNSVFSFLDESVYIVNIGLKYVFPGVDEPVDVSYTLNLSDQDFFVEEDDEISPVEEVTITDEYEVVVLTFQKMTRTLAERGFSN